MKLRHIIFTISYRHVSRKIRGRQPAKPSGIYLPWFSLSFLIFSTYTNVTKIRSIICSPSGKISSEVGCGSLDRRRWYEAIRLSLPSPMTSCDYIHRLSKKMRHQCDAIRTSGTRSPIFQIYLFPSGAVKSLPLRSQVTHPSNCPPSKTHLPRAPCPSVFRKYRLVLQSSPPYFIRLDVNRLYCTSAR